jgi:hypothetical protein
MNSRETVMAVMGDVQDLREHDRQTGQDAKWKGIDAIPNACNESLKKHGGHVTHEVVSFQLSTRTDQYGRSRPHASGIVRFNVFGSEKGKPVTGEVIAEAWERKGDPVPRFMKSALRTFYQILFLLPTDRADPDSVTFELDSPDLIDKTNEDLAQEANLTLEEYASEVVKYYMELFQSYRGPGYRPQIIELLKMDGFSELQAQNAAIQNGF